MKKLVYALIDFFVRFEWFRKFITILNVEKSAYVETLVSKKYSPDNKVLSGPFKGMIYPELKSVGSPLLPKILGSYEDELSEILKKIIATGYKTVIDIGCAEGYYAVGLAMRLPESRVFAFDTDQVAIARCKKMAKVNSVANRVELGGFCDANKLKGFPYNYPALIVCDCEGYEKQLFINDNITALSQVDILLELHEYTVPDILDYISALFKESHYMTFIKSRAKHLRNYPILQNIDQKYYKDSLIMERDDLMTWVFLEAKK